MLSRSEFRHNRAAYAREDVADSKRGYPEADLSSFASRRGMRFRGSQKLGAFMSASPVWTDYVFNAMDGALPSGRYGLIEHELDRQAIDQDNFEQGGTYHSVRTTWKDPQGWISFATSGLLGGKKKMPNEPFAGNFGWLPASAVYVRVPETNMLGAIDIRRNGNFPRFGVKDLGDFGAPGFRATGLDDDGWPANLAIAAEALAGDAGQALLGCASEYVRIEIGYGVVAFRCNGFLSEEGIKDLVSRAEAVAGAFADACNRAAVPQAFERAVPQAAPGPELSKKRRDLAAIADGGMTQAAARVASELGLEAEDPKSYTRAFPFVPVPGRARSASRGTLPGTSLAGRVIYTTQGHRSGSSVRAAVLMPASPDAPELPIGGELVEATGMYGEVANGVAAVWDRGRIDGRLESHTLLERALQTSRDLRIADA